MGSRAAQWHHGYNPVTHTGGVAPPEEKHKGVKIIPKVASTAGTLHGGACIPAEMSPSHASPTHSPKPIIPARVDHLSGTGCTPHDNGSPRDSQQSPGASSPKNKLVNLRAAVDHMSGPACTIRQVHEVATAEDPRPTIERGMTTKLTKDRMSAQHAKEQMMSSRLYNLGQGYTPVEPDRGNGPASPTR